MGAKTVVVITADIIRSRQYNLASRRKVGELISRVFADDVLPRFKSAMHTKLKFRITAGDEFQWVMKDPVSACRALIAFRAALVCADPKLFVKFRAGLGEGDIAIVQKRNPYREDGAAFILAREALESLSRRTRKADRWTRLLTGSSACDPVIDVILDFVDYFQSRWTVSQWEAIHWAGQGLSREQIGDRLNVRHQNVTKRLLAAQWMRCEAALTALAGVAACTQKRVQ